MIRGTASHVCSLTWVSSAQLEQPVYTLVYSPIEVTLFYPSAMNLDSQLLLKLGFFGGLGQQAKMPGDQIPKQC